MPKPLILAALALLAGRTARAAEINTWRGPRGDGVFPARGYPTSADEAAGTNIVWKRPLPFIGCNSPVYAGGKVFVLCDPGWESDAPLLLAFAADDGEESWRAPVDNLDAHPPAEADWARAERAREYAMARRARELQRQHNTAKDDAEKAKVLATIEAEGFAYKKNKKKKGKIALSLTSCKMVFTPPHARCQDYGRLKGRGLFEWEGWYYAGKIFQGATFPSAVSDGERVWVLTNNNAAACFAVADGKRRWLIDVGWQSKRYHGSGPINTSSPILVGEVLVLSRFDWTVGVVAASGEVLWRHRMGATGAYQAASAAVPLRVEGDDFVYLSSGEILRVADGKPAGKLVHPADLEGKKRSHGPYFGGHCQSIARGDRIWVMHCGYGGGAGKALGGVYAFRVRREGEGLAGEPLWQRGGGGDNFCIALDEERLYCFSKQKVILDAATGEVLGETRRIAHRSPVFAVTDEHVITLSSSRQNKWNPDPDYRGTGTVTFYDKGLKKVGEARLLMDESTPEVTAKRVARVGKPWWGWGRSSPTAWGNRVFVRSHDALYCLGDPGRPFRE